MGLANNLGMEETFVKKFGRTGRNLAGGGGWIGNISEGAGGFIDEVSSPVGLGMWAVGGPLVSRLGTAAKWGIGALLGALVGKDVYEEVKADGLSGIGRSLGEWAPEILLGAGAAKVANRYFGDLLEVAGEKEAKKLLQKPADEIDDLVEKTLESGGAVKAKEDIAEVTGAVKPTTELPEIKPVSPEAALGEPIGTPKVAPTIEPTEATGDVALPKTVSQSRSQRVS